MKMHFVFWSASQVSLSTIVIVTFTLGAEATFFVNCDGKSSLAFICTQVHAKKVVSNSPGLVDVFRLANSFPSLSKRQVKFFFEEF